MISAGVAMGINTAWDEIFLPKCQLLNVDADCLSNFKIG